jgi:hypothetical protein
VKKIVKKERERNEIVKKRERTEIPVRSNKDIVAYPFQNCSFCNCVTA